MPCKPLAIGIAAILLLGSAQSVQSEMPWAHGVDWQHWNDEGLDYPENLLGEAPEDSHLVDPQLIAVQNTTPTSSRSSRGRFTRTGSGRSRFSTAALRTGGAAATGLASVPFMIGDTGAGTCLSFNTIGYIEADLSHPTLTCSRLNIAENNRALASDRVYFSYRHFHNSTPGRVFQYSQNLNVDRYTLGMEKTLGEGSCSVEVRVPIEDRLTSNPQTVASDFDLDFVLDPGAQLLGGRELELANMSAIFKVMLAEHNGFLLSAGVGMTAPTAQDVLYQVNLQSFPVFYPGLAPPLYSLNNFQLEADFKNETWYFSPFLAYANKTKGSRFFHQGFMQIELPANPSTVRITDFGSVSAVTDDLVTFVPDFGAIWTINGVVGGTALLDLHAQPLMRINLGGGYYLVDESDRHDFFDQLVAMLELHYTTTLQDAKLSRVPLDFLGFDPDGTFTGAFDAFDPVVGNLNSRVDILNAVLGLSAKVNGTTISHGFTMPLRSGDNRGFDFEYNLQVQRPF